MSFLGDFREIAKTFAIGAISGLVLFKLVRVIDFKDYLASDNATAIVAGGLGALGSGTIWVLSQPGGLL